MKRIILGSLLSCMSVGQMCGVVSGKEVVSFVGGIPFGDYATIAVSRGVHTWGPENLVLGLPGGQGDYCVGYTQFADGLVEVRAPFAIGKADDMNKVYSSRLVGSGISFIGSLLAIYFCKNRSLKACALGSLVATSYNFGKTWQERSELVDCHVRRLAALANAPQGQENIF